MPFFINFAFMKQLLFALFCFFIPLSIFSQIDSTILKRIDDGVLIYSDLSFDSLNFNSRYKKNRLEDFQIYSPNKRSFNIGLGNIGLPNQSLFFSENSPVGFNFGRNASKVYSFNDDNINFFNTKKPYTSVKVILGAKKEQILDITHSQNISPFLNFGVSYRKINSLGFYKNQASNNTNFMVNANYLSKFGRYQYFSSYIRNSIKNNENGGIAYDSAFKSNDLVSLNTLSVNLNGSNSISKESIFKFKQIFRFKKLMDTVDISTVSEEDLFKRGFFHDLKYSKKYFQYKESSVNQNFYQNLFLSTNQTNDSITYDVLENGVGYFDSFFGNKFMVKFSHQNINVYNDGNYNLHSNLIASFNYRINEFLLATDYVFDGLNKRDFKVLSKKDFIFGNSGFLISIDGNFQRRNTDYFYKNYSSNHFYWDNNFSKMDLMNGNFKFSYKTSDLTVSYNRCLNLVYLDSNSIPKQNSTPIEVFSVKTSNIIAFGKFKIKTNALFQSHTATNVIRIPKIALSESVYLDFEKSKMKFPFQIGFDVFYFSSYYANSFVPALSLFKIQDNVKVGDYPFIDFFINLQVKDVSMFFKIDHLNSGFMGNNFYLTPYYPTNSRAFKFGFNWLFND